MAIKPSMNDSELYGSYARDFFKVYANVPLGERENTVIVIDGKPISWNLAYQEIKNKTKNGEKILKILMELNII